MNIKARERLLNVLIVVAVIVLLFVVGYPQYREAAPSKVKIGVDKSLGSLPFIVARDDTSRRYFVLEKVLPEFVEIVDDPLQGIKDGRYDVVAVPWYSLVISPSSNDDTMKAFASVEIKSGKILDGIVVPPQSTMKSLIDLKGKRLGYVVRDGYLVDMILNKLAKENIGNIMRIPLQPEEVPSAFAAGVDALYLLDPYRGYMVYEGNKIMLEGLISSYIVQSMPYAALVMRTNFVKKEHRLAAIRLKNALDATFSYMTRNPEVVKKFLISMHDWQNDAALALNIRIPEYHRLAEVNLTNIELLQTEMVRNEIGTCGIKPSEFLFEKTDFSR